MYLSKNFTLEELCASSTAKARHIDNTPPKEIIENLKALCVNVLQPLRDWYGKSILIGSGYRCPQLNKAVGGVSTSQHMKGEAVDLYIQGDLELGKRWFCFIKDHLIFDQLIMEHNKKGTYWVHVSFSRTKNRKQVITNLLKK